MDNLNCLIFLTLLTVILADTSSNTRQVAQNILRDKRKVNQKNIHLVQINRNDPVPLLPAKNAGQQSQIPRQRRDDTQVKNDIESAEVYSAVAAVHADKAKEDALHALEHDEKIETDMDNLNSNPAKNSDFSSSISRSKETLSAGQDNANESSGDDEEEEEEDEDGVEEIIDDGVATIKTTIITTNNSHGNSKSKTKPFSTSGSENGRETEICQNFLDLKSMTNDFHQRLQSLIDREEGVVERLDQLKNSLDKTLMEFQSIQLNFQKRTVEPTKACVYIEDKVSAQNSHQGKEFESENQFFDSNSNSKIRVHTNKGILPKNKRREHINEELTNENSKLEREGGIDLENIYWIKSNGHRNYEEEENGEGSGEGDLKSKSENVLKQIHKEGQDALIIPIDSTYKSVKDVARSFLETMNRKTLLHKKFTKRKVRLRVRRV